MQTNERLLRGYFTEACTELNPGDGKCVCVMLAIAKHDSQYATAGVGKKTNNPCNTRPSGDNSYSKEGVYESHGNGWFATYPNLRDGAYACTDLYVRRFAGRTAKNLTDVWAQTKSKSYHNAVASCY